MARRRRLNGWGGCLLWVMAFLFVVVGGCTAGLALRPDPKAPATIAKHGDWKVQVRKDDDGSACAELLVGGKLRSGQCAFTTGAHTDPNDPTSPVVFETTSIKVGAEFVSFAPVPDTVVKVRLHLANGSTPVVEVQSKKKVHAFAYASASTTKGTTELLLADGSRFALP